MPIQAECPSCRAKIRVKDELAGKIGKCPRCEKRIKIPVSALREEDNGDLVPLAPEPEKASKSTSLKPPPTSIAPSEEGDLYTLVGAAKAKAAPIRKSAATGVGVTAKGVTEAASATVRNRTPREILSAFRGEIEPVRATMLYRFWVFVVACVMVLLPLVYLSIIGIVCYGLYYHAVNHIVILEHMGRNRGSAKVALIVYVGPLVVGVIAVAFMCKPIFARRRDPHAKSRVLDPNIEPLLFAFVDGICMSVGAPKPSRIEVNCMVNASAHLDGGAFAIFKNELVLTIGLPLVAGLSLKEFAGVLAHEFGHFSQQTGMRLSWMINTVNHWFARVVYERDEWDVTLEKWSRNENFYMLALGNACRLVVWITRRCLWVLMYVGRLISGVFSRQMEFDADRYEARMVGSSVFASTSWRLVVLSIAEQRAQSDLYSSWHQRRLPDNLPKLVAANVPQLSKDLLKKIKEDLLASKTGLFDTHPCAPDRVANAKKEAPDKGIFTLSGAASDVFRNFDSLSKITTFDEYKIVLGRQITKDQLFTVSELIETQAVTQVGFDAADRFFMKALNLLQPLPLPWDYPKPATDPKRAKATLIESRRKMEANRFDYLSALKRLKELQHKAALAQVGFLFLKAGNKLQNGQFGLAKATLTCAERTRDDALAEWGSITERTAEFNNAAVQRLSQSLAILESNTVAKAIEDGKDHREEVRALYQCAAHLGSNVAPQIGTLMHTFRAMNVVIALYVEQKDQRNQCLINSLLRAGADLRDELETCRWKIGDTLYYPFEHAVEDITIGKYAMPAAVPPKDDINGLMECAEGAIQRTISLYSRVLGRVAFSAEAVERLLGLEPLVFEPGEDEADEA